MYVLAVEPSACGHRWSGASSCRLPAVVRIVTVLRLTDRLGGELSKDGRVGRAAGSRS
jgi:hypothetical protein